MNKLIKMLRYAHAGEIAAYHAYQGHWESVKDPTERKEIQKIQQDEKEHIKIIEDILMNLNSGPNSFLDFAFSCIGKTLSILCHVTGRFLPMYVAKIIEKIGAVSYQEMILEANKEHTHLIPIFDQMSKIEFEHEEYFRSKSI